MGDCTAIAESCGRYVTAQTTIVQPMGLCTEHILATNHTDSQKALMASGVKPRRFRAGSEYSRGSSQSFTIPSAVKRYSHSLSDTILQTSC